MPVCFPDPEVILLNNEEWIQLGEKWGPPVDLETDEEPANIKPAFSTLDIIKSTFDSSFLFKKVRRKVGRKLSKVSALDYKEFLKDLKQRDENDLNGISASSVEDICGKIDDIFKSINQLYSDTISLKEDIDANIHYDKSNISNESGVEIDGNDDEFFDGEFGVLTKMVPSDDEAKESVTNLVKKFSVILNNPTMDVRPRRQRESCRNFKELTEFWQCRAFSEDDEV